ncbi:MAG: peptidoglycan-binding protein [Chloroflexi bacterium]|nr:peptidoglycan-binding protein [Chloroflexota bacterium]
MPLPLRSKELAFSGPVVRGAWGKDVRRVQEWLCLNGHAVAVVGAFESATEAALRAFCTARGLPASGVVDGAMFEALSAPMRHTLADLGDLPDGIGGMVVAVAKRHEEENPREVGGQNRGPWVRPYMDGHEGSDWPRCAGFVSFVIHQACVALGRHMPFPKTYSCDTLAANAQKRNLFTAERYIDRSDAASSLAPGTIFLSWRVSGDWTHTGIVTAAGEETFATIEGNTNDEGSREGHEVCTRTRGYGNRDFVLLSRWRPLSYAQARPDMEWRNVAALEGAFEVTSRLPNEFGGTSTVPVSRRLEGFSTAVGSRVPSAACATDVVDPVAVRVTCYGCPRWLPAPYTSA